MKRFFLIKLAVIMVLFSFFTSCITVPITITSSTTPLNGRLIETNLGEVTGKDRTWAFLSLWMVRKPDIEKALNRALKKKGADALINVTCYEESSYFVFFSLHTVIIKGEAVKFIKEKHEDVPKKRKKKGKRRRKRR